MGSPTLPTHTLNIEPMKWNTAYHIYEGVALIVIILSWWMYTTDRVIDNGIHWQSFNHSMEASVQKATITSQKSDSILREDVRKNGNSREGLDRIQRAALLKKRTNAVIANLEKTKNYLKTLPQNSHDQANHWMIRQRTAYQIKDELDKYVDWLMKEFKDLNLPKFEKIANGNEENSLYFVWEPDRDFAHNYFKYAIPTEAMAILTQKQLIIKRYESEVLKKLGGGGFYSCCWCGFWKIEASTHTPINTIQVGDEYTADMFISASASKTNPRMTLNGYPITVRDGIGDVQFTAKGRRKQYWEGRITFRKKWGKDTTFMQRIPYEVLPLSKKE